MGNKYWYHVDEKRFVELAGLGIGGKAIAKELGISPFAVKRWGQRLGVRIWPKLQAPVHTRHDEIAFRKWVWTERVIPKLIPGLNGCSEWRGASNGFGHGFVRYAIRPGEHRPMHLHRLAMEVQIGRILAPGECVLHICDNPRCVTLSHLYIGTQMDNIRDMVTRGRARGPYKPESKRQRESWARGERTGNAKLTSELVRQIRDLYIPRSFGPRRIARRLGLPHCAVRDVVYGKTWNHVQP
jgi:hypothetical protein